MEVKHLISEIVTTATHIAPETQPWENYFQMRGREFEILYQIYPVKDFSRILEIGCGNGFYSILLSHLGKNVIATDLYRSDVKSHTIGMKYAKNLIQSFNISNCNLLSCSSFKLPFRDSSFDLVFSAYVLEHIRYRTEVVSEIKRILKPGGIVVTVVPNFMERLTYIPAFYLYILKRIVYYILKRFKLIRRNEGQKVYYAIDREINRKSMTKKRFLQDHPNFPFPDIHGDYNSFTQELMAHLPYRWVSLFEDKGLKTMKTFSSLLLPTHLLGIISGRFVLWLYQRSLWLHKYLGRCPCIKYLGHNFCLVSRKE